MRLAHNPSLDGLRGAAIIFVVAFHCDRVLFPGGWIGVDVFFVLSGYLITSILALELEATGRIAWERFYMRRALRLTPALLVLVAFALAIGTPISQVAAGALYVENWNKLWEFAPDGPGDIMGHTWSLATEEQFYLIWPVALLMVFRRRPVVWLCAALAAMMAIRVASRDHADWLMFALDARPLGLVIGAMLALRPVRLPPATGWAALGALVAMGMAGGCGAVPTPLVAAMAAAVVVASSPTKLGWAPLAYIGRISYGLYLYHWPIFMLGEKYKPTGAGHLWAIGLLVVVVVVAAASYEVIERPVLRLGRRG